MRPRFGCGGIGRILSLASAELFMPQAAGILHSDDTVNTKTCGIYYFLPFIDVSSTRHDADNAVKALMAIL